MPSYLTWCGTRARTPASSWSDWRAHSGPRCRSAGTGTTACSDLGRSDPHWTSHPNPTYHDRSTLFWFCYKEYDCYTLNDFGEGNCALGNKSMSCIVLPCHAIWYLSQDSLHHGQMLAIVVRLEERDSQIQFEQDAPVDGISANHLICAYLMWVFANLTQWTKHHTAVTTPAPVWPRARGNVASRQLCCGARGRRWPTQSRSDGRPCSWRGAPRGSVNKENIIMDFLHYRLRQYLQSYDYSEMYNLNRRRVYSPAWDLCALNDCHVEISQSSIIDRPCGALGPASKAHSCSHAVNNWYIL